MIIRERELNWLKEWKNRDVIKVITGVRRSGKSTIMYQYKNWLQENGVSEKQIIYLNFENLDTIELHESIALHKYIKEKTKEDLEYYLLFDEIQIVDKWEVAINSLNLDKKLDIVITGSNAKLLSSELATYLAGRYVSIIVYPFSLRESSLKDPNLTLQNYMTYGGFPGVIGVENNHSKSIILNDLLDSVLLKDVMLRNRINNGHLLRALASFIFQNSGSMFSIRKIANTIKIELGINSKEETISMYIEYLKEAYLIYELERYDLKGRKVFSRNNKFYGVDPGLRESLTSGGNKDYGHILENLVFLELLRRGYRIYTGEIEEYEIDFICEKNDELIYVQVSLNLMDEKTREREFRPLEMIADNYPKIILSLDSLDFSKSGIRNVNAEQFLKGDVDL
ncbi:MAG: ATP-binding protein [Peptostreptococcus anaerobius]|uniref:ATP-binding protein n=1 Tax=Peptostreptococcus anaerobius TaxID=1261 RepID=UPI00290D7AE2|nr:ATP-binding protein [Peptostreptococcus anaerobius]MDU5096105.1 ATP-binding protein [Peptostreptococcus anaerobius]